MTNSNYTAVMLLVDRSGSMQSIRRSAEGSINEFVNSLRDGGDGHYTIRIAQFDWHPTIGLRYDTICRSIDPAMAPEFELDPYGSTPLLDAMGYSITEFGEELSAMPENERPATVIYAVMTDGLENSSREFTWDQIKTMVTRQEKEYGWNIVYLGANQDAFLTGEKLGVPKFSTMTYAASDYGTRSATQSLGAYVTAAASGQSAAFTDEQRADATKH